MEIYKNKKFKQISGFILNLLTTPFLIIVCWLCTSYSLKYLISNAIKEWKYDIESDYERGGWFDYPSYK